VLLARKWRVVFPLSEIDKKSLHIERIKEALSKVVREKGISELDPASSSHSDLLFWFNALKYIGIKDLGIVNQFSGLTNSESFRVFSRLTEEYLSQLRSASCGENSLVRKNSLCQRIQGETLRPLGTKIDH
jgi:hypothetical protein